MKEDTKVISGGGCHWSSCQAAKADDSVYCAPHRDKKRALNAAYSAKKTRRPTTTAPRRQSAGVESGITLAAACTLLERKIRETEAQLAKLQAAHAALKDF